MWAWAYFCIPPIKKRYLPPGFRHLPGVSGLSPGDDVTFQLRVCPVGWSWAVALVQAGHECILRDIRPDLPWVKDRIPTAPIAKVHGIKVLYIDNCAVLADTPEMADKVVTEMEEFFRQHSIKTARDDKIANGSALLGFTLDAKRR